LNDRASVETNKMYMIVERNDISTTEGERRITLFVTNCGIILVLK
jgi:hypothetical protein